MRVVCISDTHGLHDALQAAQRIPDGDVLVHAGDFTDTGDRDEVLAFNEFLGKLPHKYKLVVAGNHESTFDRQFYPFNWQQYGHRQQYDPDEVRALLTNGLYLEDQAVLIEGFKFYGTPWQPEFCNWAFNLPRGEKLLEKWQLIPSDTDVLITHTPPFGRGDRVGYMNVGCEELTKQVTERIQPQFHVFGHVHEGYGKSSDGTTIYMNASSCTHDYEAINPAFVFDLMVSKAGGSCSDGIPETSKATEYALMLHEQLRVCSQKVPFVSKPLFKKPGEETKNGARKRLSLREFRVDGTTSALLLESTLKVRPVVGEQTRALRYLFHNGFSGNGLANASGSKMNGAINGGDAVSQAEKEADEQTNGHDSASSASGLANGSATTRAERRRQSTIMRRVTMAVLNDVAESKELTGAEIQELESSASTISTENGSAKNPGTGRVRRNKTLQRREGRARLASMPEEPDEKQQEQPAPQEEEEPAEVPAAPVEAPVVETPPPPPPAALVVECVLCKYKVPGHVHPGATPSVVAPEPPAVAVTPAVGESSEDAAAKQEEPSETERQKNLSTKRLSSWF